MLNVEMVVSVGSACTLILACTAADDENTPSKAVTVKAFNGVPVTPARPSR